MNQDVINHIHSVISLTQLFLLVWPASLIFWQLILKLVSLVKALPHCSEKALVITGEKMCDRFEVRTACQFHFLALGKIWMSVWANHQTCYTRHRVCRPIQLIMPYLVICNILTSFSIFQHFLKKKVRKDRIFIKRFATTNSSLWSCSVQGISD